MVYRFFDRKTELQVIATSNVGTSVNEELAQELHKLLIKTFRRGRVYARFKYYNIWAADLTEMRLLSSKNQGVKHLLCEIDFFTKYHWVKPLKDKRSKAVLNGFIKIWNESYCKTNKLGDDQGKEFYNSLIQKWLDQNHILMYLTKDFED